MTDASPHIIIPYVGVLPIEFGMSPNEVENGLRLKPQDSWRNSSGVLRMSYGDYFVDFDKDNHCNFIEFSFPFNIEILNNSFNEMNYLESAKIIFNMDNNAFTHDSGHSVISLSLGIALWTSDIQDCHTSDVTLSVFVKDYYKKWEKQFIPLIDSPLKTLIEN